MLLDKQNMFSDQQTIAAAAGAILSTNTIDLRATGSHVTHGSPLADIGKGEPKSILIQVTETVTSGGAATVQFQLVADDLADLSTYEVVAESPAIALATLVAGYQARIGYIPPGITKRYLGCRYVIATATTTAGKVSAGIVEGRQASY